MLTISISTIFDMAIRFVNENAYEKFEEEGHVSGALPIAAGLSQIAITVVTLYGCIEAILYDKYDRHILAGFDDAVIETTLKKSQPNKHLYTGGKWANPRPLHGFSLVLGLAGIANMVLYGGDDSSQHSSLFLPHAYWLATAATLLWVTSFLFALRHEVIHMVKSMVDAILFATLTYGLIFSAVIPEEMNGSNIIDAVGCSVIFCFGLVNLLLLGIDIVASKHESTALHQTDVELLSHGFMTLSLIITAAVKGLTTNSSTSIPFLLTSAASYYYGATAELVNSITQKEILPVLFLHGCRQQIFFFNRNANSSDVEEQRRSWKAFIPPGDSRIYGQSEFPSPIFVMITCCSLHAIIQSAALYIKLFALDMGYKLVALSSFGSVIAHLAVMIISIARGQTSIAFSSLSFFLSGLAVFLLCLPVESSATGAVHVDKINIGVLQ